MNKNIVADFKRLLNDLQFSKLQNHDWAHRDCLIVALKTLALTDVSCKKKIVKAIQEQASIVEPRSLFLIVKLIYEIVSSYKGQYEGLFDRDIVHIFFSAFISSNDEIRSELFYMRSISDPYFSKKVLNELDSRMGSLGPGWLHERSEQLAMHREKMQLIDEIEMLKKALNSM